MDRPESSEFYHPKESRDFVLGTKSIHANGSSRTASFITRHDENLSTEDGSEPLASQAKSLENENLEDEFTKPFSLLREVAVVFTICMAQIMALAGVLQALAPLHIIGNSFGVRDPGQLSWFIAAFSLTAGTFILPAGMFHIIETE